MAYVGGGIDSTKIARGLLRVLMVEDSEDDAALLRRELLRGGYVVTAERVQTAAAMAHALVQSPWDVVISDYSMPGFDALAALKELQRSAVDIPLIVVSGTIGEDAAVAVLQAGAYDFISKNRLARLLPAIERAREQRLASVAKHKAEAQLRASEARHRQLFDNNPLPTWVFDTRTLRFLAVNEAAIREYGYTRGEFAALTLGDIRRSEVVLDVSDERAPDATDSPRTWLHRTKDGSTRTVEVHTHDVDFEGSEAKLVLVNDISARLRAEMSVRRTQEQLRVAKKLEAIGKLAAGVAHDFNNLLSVILSYTSLLLDDDECAPGARADLEEVRRAGERAADLTRQLLAFGRQQVLETQLLDVNETVRAVEKMLRTLVSDDISVSVVLRALGSVRAAPAQLERVVMNLVVNARDAMPSGGKLTIETRTVDVGATGGDAAVPTGSYVVVSVRDTGTGMDAETRERIFEPFFTTKPVGRGTGLGLSTVFGIVKQSNGHITVQSGPGAGTIFDVYLPREEERVQPAIASTVHEPVLTGTETVLLVDDDEQVRAVVRAVLHRSGYQVLVAENAGEALLVCEQYPETIHLLLSDVVMPRMSGVQLARRVAPLQPGMKVLLISGHADTSAAEDAPTASELPFLQKPITPHALLTKVRLVLDS